MPPVAVNETVLFVNPVTVPSALDEPPVKVSPTTMSPVNELLTILIGTVIVGVPV